MSVSPRAVRLGLVVALVGAIWTGSAGGATAVQLGTRCVDYLDVMEAPKGKIPRDDLVAVRKDPLKSWISSHPRQAARAAAGATVTIPVAFHVVRKGMTETDGNVPGTWIDDQIQVLNDSFSGQTGGVDTGFRFRLASVDRTTEPSWFQMFDTQGGLPRFERGSSNEIKMKEALYEGDARTLNVYTSKLGKFLLGWAYYPEDFAGADPLLPRFYDGVVIDYRTLPGADYGPYDLGDTLTHEVGHWLGLYHTFQGGCVDPGDLIADTPYEASPAFGCPTGRDTCEQPGLDPITNFMDYTDDECMFEFTGEQGERARQIWAAYRA
jgi:hypothetical protein